MSLDVSSAYDIPKSLKNIFPGLSNLRISFITFSIEESSLIYSPAFIVCRDKINTKCEDLARYLSESTGVTRWYMVDPQGDISRFQSGNPPENLHGSFPMYELIESTSGTRHILNTMELGCCVTYSHHIFKTKCITCAIIAEEIEPLIEGARNFALG